MLDGMRRWLRRSLISDGEFQWWRAGGGAVQTPANVQVSPGNAMQSTTVARCVGLISDTAAMMHLGLYKRRPDRRGRDEQFDHPISAVANVRPNAWQTPFEFWRYLYIQVALRGNGYAFLRKDGRGRVIEMIPLHSDFVQVFVADDLTPVYQFSFMYGSEKFRVTQDEIMHLRWRSDDGYLGVSPVRLAAKAIGLSMAAEDYGSRFFGDGARSSGVLTIPGKLSPEAVARVGGQWDSQFTGTQGAKKTIVLSDGATYDSISVTPEEGQFLETRGFQVEDLCRIWGVPPFLVGSTAKVTSWGTGLEQQLKGFLSLTMLPLLEMTQQSARRDLLLPSEMGSMFFEYDTDKLNAADLLQRAQAQQLQLMNGVINPNEARAEEGRNPYEGGDEFRVPANTVQQMDPPAPTPAAPADPTQDPNNPEENANG